MENLIIDYTKFKAMVLSPPPQGGESMSESEKDAVLELENMMIQVNEIAFKVSQGEEVPEDAAVACRDYIQRFPKAFKAMVDLNRKFLGFSRVPPNCS